MLDELQTKLPNFDFASTLFLGFIDAQPLNSFQFFFFQQISISMFLYIPVFSFRMTSLGIILIGWIYTLAAMYSKCNEYIKGKTRNLQYSTVRS